MFVEEPTSAQVRGVVDQKIDSPEPLDRLCEEPVDHRRLTEIADEWMGLSPRFAERIDGYVQGIAVDIRRHDRHPLGHQPRRATPRPIPLAAPVMTATPPVSSG